jgi:hypothetical protein
LSEAALAKRAERRRFLETFEGRLDSWSGAVGKTVAAIALLPGQEERVAVAFADGSFLLTCPAEAALDVVEAGLIALREQLEPRHEAAYADLDRLRSEEAEAMRLARMEKVLGAVQTNLPQIPELRAELLRLLDLSGVE